MDAKAEHRVVALITRGAAAPQVLLAAQGRGLRLPEFTLWLEDSRALAPALRAAVAERFGLAVAVLALLHRRRGEGSAPEYTLVGLDAVNVPKDGTEPASAVWRTAADLEAVAFTDATEAAHARDWLAGLAAGTGHPLRLPWTRPGWLAEATAWVEAQLAAHGLTLAGPVEQQRTWSLSALLRAPLADGGAAYFKALPPFFAAEPRLTQALAPRFPAQLPAVIAIDDARAWLLMRAFEGPLLQRSDDLAVWVAALRGYARLQTAAAGDPGALLRLGCPDRRLPALPGHLAAVLADTEHLRLGQPRGLTAAELADLHTLLPLLPAACAALEACGLPSTLEHGDLHGNNIACAPHGFVYFDWSDACLAHPFTCLTTFLETARPEWHAPLTQAYLAEWRPYAPPAALHRAHALSQPLGAAHLAVSYHAVLAGTEPAQRWQLAGALPFFLKEVLKYKAALNLAA